MKIACSFDVYISDEKNFHGENELNTENETVITSDWQVPSDCIEFNPDILVAFQNCEQYKGCKVGNSYHVFMYGKMTPQYSYSFEGGEEFGWLFEDEYVSVEELPPDDREEP